MISYSTLYIADWKASVDSRPGFTRGEKALMCLSKETIEGLHITGNLRAVLHYHFVFGVF